jgi:hypothetical protein
LEVDELNKRVQLFIIVVLLGSVVSMGVIIAGYYILEHLPSGTDGHPPHGVVQIQSMSSNSGNLLIHVQNIGNANLTLYTLYVNGKSQTFTNSSSLTLQMGQTVALSTALPSGFSSTNPVDVKIVCTDGTYIEAIQTIP